MFELPSSRSGAGPGRAALQKQHVRGQWREYWVWPHPDHFIWGATAAIMHHLAGKLRCASAEIALLAIPFVRSWCGGFWRLPTDRLEFW